MRYGTARFEGREREIDNPFWIGRALVEGSGEWAWRDDKLYIVGFGRYEVGAWAWVEGVS